MRLDGFAARDVTPWETASGGKAVGCAAASCSATLDYPGAAGTFDVAVNYFDQSNGASRYRLMVAGREVDGEVGDLHERRHPGSSATTTGSGQRSHGAKWQAADCSGATSRSSGSSRQRSAA